MGDSEIFAIFIHHGGGIVNKRDHVVYVGGKSIGRFGFDEDRFGYFDLKDEVEQLGYMCWDDLLSKIPYTNVYKKLKDDNDVVEMLKHLSNKCRAVSVFVDNDKKVEEVECEKQVDECTQLTCLTQVTRNEIEGDIIGDMEQDKTGDAAWDKKSLGVVEQDFSTEDDLDYAPSDEELTDDTLCDNELASEDDEYLTSRWKLKSERTPVEMFDKYVGVYIGFEDIEDEKNEDEGLVSEYDESDGYLNSSSTEDEHGDVKKRKKMVVYDPKCDHKQLNIVFGMRFESGYQAKEALITCAIENGWHLHFKRVDKTRIEAKCTPPCNCRCYGRSDVLRIMTIKGTHSCPRSMTNKLVTSKWIAKQYLKILLWAVTEVENEVCWTWFLQILLKELGINDGNGFTFISDQQKGIINAVGKLAPLAEHRNCARHVYCNLKKRHKGSSKIHKDGSTLHKLFWRACKSTYMAEYKLALEDMRKENEAAYQDFLERDPHKFCKTFISLAPVSDMIDNNVSEIFNGSIAGAREKHIIDMLEEIRRYLMERQVRKLNEIHGVTSNICPNIMKKFNKKLLDSRHCIAHPALGGKFEVQRFEETFVVMLDGKSCTCRAWDITGIPCVHAIAAIHFLKKDPTSFIHEYYHVSKFLEAYKHGLKPLNGKKMWPDAEGYPVRSPFIKKMPGRPKKNRRRDPDERNPKDPNKLRRTGVIMTCRRCMQTGHNSRTCKNEQVEAPPKEQKKR